MQSSADRTGADFPLPQSLAPARSIDGQDGQARGLPVEHFKATHALEQRLIGLQKEHDELRQAIFAAAQMQRRLCSPREVRQGQFEIAGEIFPTRHLSGDFYQVLELGAITGLAIGDIAGKGLVAGLWMTYVAGLIRTHLGSGLNPAEVATAVNKGLWAMRPEAPMVALFLAQLDHQRGELTYCNAGQPPAIALRADGRAESLETGGPMLGAIPDARFVSGRIVLDPGDKVISHTDGIVECRNDQGEEFGTERLIAASRSAGPLGAANILFTVLGAAQDFAAGHPPEDDLSLMVIRRQPA
jgi:sigma-B regulation protein RsbU (phosphoserine phosphatase)